MALEKRCAPMTWTFVNRFDRPDTWQMYFASSADSSWFLKQKWTVQDCVYGSCHFCVTVLCYLWGNILSFSFLKLPYAWSCSNVCCVCGYFAMFTGGLGEAGSRRRNPPHEILQPMEETARKGNSAGDFWKRQSKNAKYKEMMSIVQTWFQIALTTP